MQKDASQIGQEIKAIRKGLGLTQAKLAALVNVDPQTVARWERGERTPSADDYKAVRELARPGESRSGLSQTVPRGTQEDAWQPNPALRNLIPGRAYEVAIDYCRRLVRAKQPVAWVEEAERLMIDGRYAQMNKRGGRELGEEDWIKIVDATWEVIREIMELEGVHV